MKQLKLTTIIIAIMATFASCKKENIVNQREPKDYISTNMKMKFGNETLEYTAKYSPSTNTGIIEGKDAKRFNELNKKYKECVAIYNSETEVTFYKTKNELLAEIASNKNGNRLAENLNVNIVNKVISNNIEFYRNTYYNDLLNTFIVKNHQGNNIDGIDAAPTQSFQFYTPLNDGTDNYGPTIYSVITPGLKRSSLGYDNDRYSSLKVITTANYLTGLPTNNPAVDYGSFMLLCFQHTNYGGKAIGFPKPNSLTIPVTVERLSQKRFNVYGSDWNDSFSSYWAFYF